MYKEKAKAIVREKSLRKAVKLLTKDRRKSTIADREYLRRVWNEIGLNGNVRDKYLNDCLSEQTVNRWEDFFDSINVPKKAKNLKIAYLCGPDPLNDLEVLIELGILQENIWAIEADTKMYNEAISALITSNFPFLKIIKSDFKSFIEYTPIKFDIIYLDFCDPIYNRGDGPKNLEAITTIAKLQVLNSPGILITNFSLVTQKQDELGHRILSKLVAGYLYPKSFLEDPEQELPFIEGPEAHSIYEEEFINNVEADLPAYYSQFVTRVLMDIFCINVSADRLMSNPKLLKLFFDRLLYKNKPRYLLRKKIESLFTWGKNGGGGDIFTDRGEYSLPWSYAHYMNIFPLGEEDEEFEKHGKKFMDQLASYSKNGHEYFEKMAAFYYLKGEGWLRSIFYSQGLKKIFNEWRAFERHIFCDVFMFHQLVDLLIRQVSVPYHINIKQSRRWKYKAKDTEMYQDLIVFDECRYLYDWMPTMDMLKDNLSNMENELAFRYILDALAKETRWYFDEIFSGTAVIDQDTKGFKAKTLKKRKVIIGNS